VENVGQKLDLVGEPAVEMASVHPEKVPGKTEMVEHPGGEHRWLACGKQQ